MMGRASAQPQSNSTHMQPEVLKSTATAPASMAEEPDLELGLLPRPNADSASVLHSSAPDNGAARPDR